MEMVTTEVGSSSSSSRGGSRNGGGGGGGRARGRHMLKKGPWTEAEDAELVNYVKRHGEGNWNVVHKNSGLRRCGKSCRLRWANHLRPNLKKGPFSPEEEEIIIKLHAKYGNKWARMASQLDGRTDNEIKNYWNARLKKRQRTGLPIYPVQTPPPPPPPQQQPPPIPISPSSSLTSFFSASSSSQQSTATYTNNSLTISPLNYPPYRNNITTTNNPFSFFSRINNNNNNNNVINSYNPSSSFPNSTYSSMPLFHQTLSASSLPFSSLNLNTSPPLPAVRASSFDPVNLFNVDMSTTTIQSPAVPTPSTAQTSSDYTGSEGGILGGASSSTAEYVHHIEAGNGGLLEDLLEQSQTVTHLEKLNEEDIVGEEDRGLLDQNGPDDFSVNGLGQSNCNPEVYLHDPVSTHSNVGMNEKNEIVEADMNVLDDDLTRLLECPSPIPIPDWYDNVDTTNYSNGLLPSNAEGNVETNNDLRQASPSPAVTTTTSTSSCRWNYMPRVL